MKHILVIFLISALFTQCKEVEKETVDDGSISISWSSELSEKISRDFESVMERTHVPGAALAIIHNGKVVKKEFFGYADVENKIPITDTTEFWLASISKHITTSLILKLEENGLLSRHDYVKDIITNLPDAWNGIKLEHLMSHTSGIYGYDNWDKLDSWWEHLYADKYKGKQISLEEYIEMLPNVPIGNKPGEVFDYSDTGMDILAVVASIKTGKPFEQLLSEYIFVPSKMTARIHDFNALNPNLVKAYDYSKRQLSIDKNREDVFSLGSKAFGGSGNLIVTLQDMINWNKALDNNSILKEETKVLLSTPYQLNSGELIEYGLGLTPKEYPGGYAIGHGGVAGTEYWKFPDSDITIIILSNLASGSGGLLTAVAEDLGLLNSITPDPQLKRFNKNRGPLKNECIPAGAYSFAGFDGTVYIENQELFFLVPGMIFKLIPLENCEFLAFSKGTSLLDGNLPEFYLKTQEDKLVMVLEENHPWGTELEGSKISE